VHSKEKGWCACVYGREKARKRKGLGRGGVCVYGIYFGVFPKPLLRDAVLERYFISLVGKCSSADIGKLSRVKRPDLRASEKNRLMPVRAGKITGIIVNRVFELISNVSKKICVVHTYSPHPQGVLAGMCWRLFLKISQQAGAIQ